MLRFASPLAVLAVCGAALCQPGDARATGRWLQAGPLITARSNHSATLLADGRVLIAGGNNLQLLSSAELYNAATRAWSATGGLNVARNQHTASLLQGPECQAGVPPPWCNDVLVAGGATVGEAEIYDPDTGAWTMAAALGTPRRRHTATVLPNGRVLVVGGLRSGDLQPVPPAEAAEVYDPVTGQWSSTGPPAIPHFDHQATLLANGTVLIAGGRGGVDDPATPAVREDLQPTARAEVYDPATGQWLEAGSLAVARTDHTVTLLGGPACQGPTPAAFCGSALAVGGVDVNAPAFAPPRRSAELYTPGPGTWSGGPSLSEARATHSASPLPDGGVLIAGGHGGLGGIPSAEVYDPSAAAWRFTGPLVIPRFRHVAVVLAGTGCASDCGKVLVAGGERLQTNSFLSSAELYDPSAATAPTRVSDLAGAAGSGYDATLRFSAVGSVEGYPPPARRYVVRRAAAPITGAGSFERANSLCAGVCTFSPTSVGDPITLRVTALEPERTYHFAVRAMDGDGNLGPVSNSVAVSTRLVAPGAVTSLSASPRSATAVRLDFAAAGSNGTGPPPAQRYIVKQSRSAIRNAAEFTAARTLCGGTCAFSPARVGDSLTLGVTGLRPRTSYHYAVRARDEAGNLGPLSRSVTARTRRDRTPPGRVTRLSARSISSTRIKLKFRAPGSDGRGGSPARRYVVKRSTRRIDSRGRFRRARSLCRRVCRFAPRRVGGRLTLTVTGLRPATRYHFALRAQDGSGNLGPRSPSRSAKTRRP